MAKLSAQLCGNFGAFTVTSLPFEDCPSTRARQTGNKQAPGKQTREPLAMIHTWIVSSLV